MSLEQAYEVLKKTNIQHLDIASARTLVGSVAKSPSAKYTINGKEFEVRYETLKGMGELTYNAYLNRKPMTKYDPFAKLIDATPEFTKLRQKGDKMTLSVLVLLPILVAEPTISLNAIKKVSYKNKMTLNKMMLELTGGAKITYRDNVYNLNIGVRGGEYILVGGRKVYV